MDGLVFLLRVSRPMLWPILPMVYYLGLHASGSPLTPAAVLQMALLTFPMNLFGCGLNDMYDHESDRQSSRRRALWGAVVGETERPLVWRACVFTAPLIMLGSLLTQLAANVFVTGCHLLIAWMYSVPPVRLKERPPLDSLANGLGYFLLPLAMGYSLGRSPAEMPLRYYLLALCVAGIHSLATAADYIADRAAGHRTMAVAFGRRTAAAVALATFVIAIALGDYQSGAVYMFLTVGALAALVAVIWPKDRPIAVACTTIFVGFLLAAICHIAGW